MKAAQAEGTKIWPHWVNMGDPVVLLPDKHITCTAFLPSECSNTQHCGHIHIVIIWNIIITRSSSDCIVGAELFSVMCLCWRLSTSFQASSLNYQDIKLSSETQSNSKRATFQYGVTSCLWRFSCNIMNILCYNFSKYSWSNACLNSTNVQMLQ